MNLFVSISNLQTLLIDLKLPTADQKHAQHSLGLVICLVVPLPCAARDEYTALVMPQRRVNVLGPWSSNIMSQPRTAIY